MKRWKVASFNVNSIRARLPILIEWLHANQPHALCLQETKAQDHDFPAEAIQEAGYNVAYRGEKSYNGVAIISQSEPVDVRYGLGDGNNSDETRLIAAVVDNVPVVNTYVPQGRDPESEHFQYKLKWFDRLLAFFKKNYSPSEPLLWIGDLNIAPEPIDVHDPKGLLGHPDFHPDVQKKLAKVMAAFGLVDVFRKHVPGPGQYTFWDYRVRNAMPKGVGWRVDHILATKPLADQSLGAWIDKKPRSAPQPSDHTPIVAEFKLD